MFDLIGLNRRKELETSTSKRAEPQSKHNYYVIDTNQWFKGLHQP